MIDNRYKTEPCQQTPNGFKDITRSKHSRVFQVCKLFAICLTVDILATRSLSFRLSGGKQR